MKLLIFSLIFLCFCQAAVAQKDTSQSYDAGEIKELLILTDEVYRINIRSVAGDQVILTTHSEGEYYNDIHLEVKRSQHQMLLTSRFDENLPGGFDKLSAHKVFSLEITLEVPHGLDVHTRSNLASVSASGKFRNFRGELQQGNASLNNFSGNAVVNTYRGNIYVKTTNASIKATTGTGNVSIPQNSRGLYSIELRSVTGDIKVEEN
jgi:hypothetical protein